MDFRPRPVRVKVSKNSGKNGASGNGASAQVRSTSTAVSSITKAGVSAAEISKEDLSPGSSKISNLTAIKSRRGSMPSTPKNSHDEEEKERLAFLLWTMEVCFGDWGLSTHRSSGMLERMRLGDEDGVHIQHVLSLPPIQALTSTQADVQKAIQSDDKLTNFKMIKLSPSGFHVVRTEAPDFDALDKMTKRDWDRRTLYLENIPSLPGQKLNTHLLARLLSVLFNAKIQNLVLPTLHDPYSHHYGKSETKSDSESNPDSESESESRKPSSFRHLRNAQKSQRGRLPRGGGLFKGFAFLVLSSENDGERILSAWKWRNGEVSRHDSAESKIEEFTGTTDVERGVVNGEKAEADHEEKNRENGVQNMTSLQARFATLVKEHGLQAMSLNKWLELKKEYLSYRRDIYQLLNEAEYRKKGIRQDRERYSRVEEAEEYDWREMHSSTSTPNPKRDFSSQEEYLGDSLLSSEMIDGPIKRAKRPRLSDPKSHDIVEENSSVVGPQSSYLPPPPPFPAGCVLWIRNLNEKSTRSSLRTTFSTLLESLEEGSGTGIEFVDYEKGLDNCHMRFSSSHLASIVFCHLNKHPSLHASPTSVSAFNPGGLNSASPLKVQLLEGQREKIYWDGLPASTKRGASRKSAGGGDDVDHKSNSMKQNQREVSSMTSSEIQANVEALEDKDSKPQNARAQFLEKRRSQEVVSTVIQPDVISQRPRKKPSRL